jgi:hypothetical protein
MTDFYVTWELVRKRFDDAVFGLSEEQLNFRLHPNAMTIGEMSLHVAGVEVWFMSQLLQSKLETAYERVAKAATDGAVNDNPFPFAAEEITPDFVKETLDYARAYVSEHIKAPHDALLSASIKSALGPMIDGRGALARLAYHPSYHQAQVYLISTAPGFPG